MIFKTSCDNCVYTKYKCDLGRQVFYEDDKQRTYGLCSFKRASSQLDSTGFVDAKKENSRLSLIILNEDNNVALLKETLKAAKEIKQISQLIVSTMKGKYDLDKINVEMLSSSGLPWSYNLSVSNSEFLPRAVERVRNRWFFPIINGQSLSKLDFDKFEEQVTNPFNSLICLYLNNLEDMSKIISTEAYLSMRGNEHQPWIEKVKSFENWELVCKKLQ